MYKLTKAVIAAVISMSAVVSTGAQASLKLSHALPTEHPVHQSLDWFAKEVRKDAKVRVKVYPNGTLGNEAEGLQMVQNGTVAFTKASAATLNTFSKDYMLLSLPYLYSSREQYLNVLNGPIGQEILASSRDSGFIGLAFLDAGERSFYTSKPIKTPEDLKGMKIRIQNSAISIDTIRALGGTPVPLPYGELYSAMQQGVVDGAENNIPSYFSSRHYEVKKVYSRDMHTMVPDVLVISTKVWDTLTKEQQEGIRSAAQKTVAIQEANWADYEKEAVEMLKGSGVEFVDSDVPKFQEAVKPVYEKFKKENPDLVPLLNEIQATK